MQYRRAGTGGGSYFFTVVTHDRRPFLSDARTIEVLRSCMSTVKERHPFSIDAMVVMPDHIHSVWTLPEDDRDFGIRWSLIKSGFTRMCDDSCRGVANASRIARKEQAVWQHRFWEHQIRDEEDFKRHVEYIHYNPVKHGYVKAPAQWRYSSFHRYVRHGFYAVDWGSGHEVVFPDGIGHE